MDDVMVRRARNARRLRLRRAIAALSLVLPVVAVACTPVRFGSLQSEYDTIVTLRQRCDTAVGLPPDGAGRPAATVESCAGDTNVAFLEIARNAKAAADKASNEKTRIGIYRLIALAGWQSRLPEGFALQEEAVAKGDALCEKLKSDPYRPPRDCALFKVTRLFVIHTETAIALQPLVGRDGAAWTDADKATLGRLALDNGGYYVRVWSGPGALKAWRDRFAADKPTQQVAALIDWQRTRIQCLMAAMVTAATTASLPDVRRTVGNQMIAFEKEERLPRVPACE